MEDAATAEISRAQLWQWLHFIDDGREPLHLDDGTPVDFALLERALIGLPSKLGNDPAVVGASRVDAAIAMLADLTHRDTLVEFLTLPAYDTFD
jgi:malate synthase